MRTPAFSILQLISVGDARSAYQVPSPESAWPIPQLPLNAMSLHGCHSGEQGDCAQDIYVYHCVNVATALANTAGRDVGAHNPIQDITVGFELDRFRMNVYCKEAPGSVVFTDPAAEDEGNLNSLPETEDFGHRSFSEIKDRTQGPIPTSQRSHSPIGCTVVHS